MELPTYSQKLINIEKRTQRFMLGALGLMLLVLLMIGLKQDYFSRSTSIYFLTSNAQGLSKGMAVKFVGFKVGSVQEISMEPNAAVRVRVSLNDEYLHLIGQDAKARLIKEALVGESVVEIVPGSTQVRQVTQGSVLEFERGQDAASVIESLASQLQPILSDMRQFAATINKPDGDIQQTLKNLNQVTAATREMVNQVTRLGVSGNQKLDSVYLKLDQALEHANSSLGALDKAIPQMVERADTTLSNAQEVTNIIKQVTQDSAREIPSLINNVNTLVQGGQETLDGVQQSWPLNRMLPKVEEQRLPVDGYVAPEEP
ncbi:MAG: MlaD family protein [Sideroxydans sp.]|jgi:phospholipid/cholesterol/gamma-HCH transport system substrate-binding protein